MTSPSFADCFSYDAFLAFVEHDKPRHGRKLDHAEGEEWRTGFLKLVDDRLSPALKEFLEPMRASGALAPVPNSEGRSTWFLHAWNGWVQDSEAFAERADRLWWHIVSRTAQPTLASVLWDAVEAAQAGDGDGVRAAYDKFTDRMTRGEIRWWHSMAEEYCHVSGEEYRIDIRGWQVVFGTLPEDRGDELVPMRPLARKDTVELEVELATGELLVADWFRLDEFTKAVDDGKDEDINSVLGRERATERYLRDHGFVSVFVGNSMPQVALVDGCVVIGECDDDDPAACGLDLRGRVSTELWWATVIERQRLVDIVAGEVGADQAERKVAAYLKANRHDCLSLKVPPGTYRLHFSGAHREFAAEFRAEGLPLPAIQPFLVLANRPLELAGKPAADTGARRAP